MFNSKYSNFLTVLLVIAIIAIIGVVGYCGYDIYRKYYTNKDAEEAISQFDSAIGSNENDKADDNTDFQIEGIDDALTTTGDGSKTQTKYKGYNMMGYIEIPKINIKYPVLEKASKQAIKVAVGILDGPGLNQPGNTLIIGHNYRNGLFFSNLKKLSNGDTIYITDANGTRLKYNIYSVYETAPEDATYMLRDIGDGTEITLSTCTDNGSARTIIWARAE